MWDLSRPGIEAMSPALAGGFLTTGPPGKPWRYFWSSSGSQSDCGESCIHSGPWSFLGLEDRRVHLSVFSVLSCISPLSWIHHLVSPSNLDTTVLSFGYISLNYSIGDSCSPFCVFLCCPDDEPQSNSLPFLFSFLPLKTYVFNSIHQPFHWLSISVCVRHSVVFDSV